MAEITITTAHRYINDAKIVDPPRDIIILTVELQWLEHLRDHENQFETGVVRANEGRW